MQCQYQSFPSEFKFRSVRLPRHLRVANFRQLHSSLVVFAGNDKCFCHQFSPRALVIFQCTESDGVCHSSRQPRVCVRIDSERQQYNQQWSHVHILALHCSICSSASRVSLFFCSDSMFKCFQRNIFLNIAERRFVESILSNCVLAVDGIAFATDRPVNRMAFCGRNPSTQRLVLVCR